MGEVFWLVRIRMKEEWQTNPLIAMWALLIELIVNIGIWSTLAFCVTSMVRLAW